MGQLIFKTKNTEQQYWIKKTITTVGGEASCDLVLPTGKEGVLFTLHRESGSFFIIPGDSNSARKMTLNGDLLRKRTAISSCDRIEWQDSVAVFIHSDVPVTQSPGSESGSVGSLEFLQNLAAMLNHHGSARPALQKTLQMITETANAEVGYLLSEIDEVSGWQLLGTFQLDGRAAGSTRRELISNTILTEAIQKRAPVYVENMIGHPWSDAASVIEARIFSAACFPLMIGEKVFGAVFLFTRSPGKPIKQNSLSELNLLASQAALMLASEIKLKGVQSENDRLRKMVKDNSSPFIFSNGSPIQSLIEKARRVGSSSLSVVLHGETGTGKELFAREVHSSSERKGPFVAINCAAIPETLLESTLFGYEKGAFTGADQSRSGKFLQANNGTLFLDEIGDLPLSLQGKLLRVLQENVVEPLGGKPTPINVRLVSASHRDLSELVRQGKFREDLYFRINGVTLQIPPLRDRRDDLLVLAKHFLDKSGFQKKFSPEAIQVMEDYRWPGNIRELEQVIARAAVLSESDVVQVSDLELSSWKEDSFQNVLSKVDEVSSLKAAQQSFTREYVRSTLDQCRGNRTQAASQLGISERTLYRILSEPSQVSL